MLTVAVGGGSLSLFLWFKMRMVTGVPRSAYADPESAPTPPKPSATEPLREPRQSDGRFD